MARLQPALGVVLALDAALRARPGAVQGLAAALEGAADRHAAYRRELDAASRRIAALEAGRTAAAPAVVATHQVGAERHGACLPSHLEASTP